MVSFDFDTKCYSCSLCVEYCPTNAITFDAKLHPILDESKCIHCSKCEKVCMELNSPINAKRMEISKSYVAKNKDMVIRGNSSSGGVFIEIANFVIQSQGYVCGCIYDDDMMPKHIITNDLEICKKMMGSKYVKSDMSDCLHEINRLINNEQLVLFTGVPCQIAAVRSCIKSEKLLTVAVVCHGSIERDVWKRYLDEETETGSIVSVTMRDKSRGCLNYGLKFTYADGSEKITYREENGYFLKSFTDGLLERERCLNCVYKGGNIQCDILLGDAWGMDEYYPDFIDDLGCSVILILTQTGERLFQMIKEKFEVKDIDSSAVIRCNPRIITPAPENPFRKSFQKKLEKRTTNIHLLTKRYAKPTFFNRLKWKAAKLLLR